MASENEDRETLTGIVAEIRAYGAQPPPRLMWLDIADRIEAAAERDEERAIEHATRHAEAVARDNCRDCVHNPNGKNYEGVGNAAATREALVKIHGIAKTFMDATRMRHVTDSARIDVADIEALAKAALAAPLRQCDVGTAEEQYERYRHRCDAQDCCYCPVRKRWDFSRTGSESCQLVWAQMPYAEEGGAK